MEATAALHHSEPNEFAAPTPPVPAVAAPRAKITSFFSGISPLTDTGAGATDTPSLTYPLNTTPPRYHTP